MDETLKNIILELTSSQLIVNWLELCGFQSLEDIEKINENVLIDIENYVGSVCSLMPLDKRDKYIQVDVFQSYPMQFKLPPNLKIKLLSASEIITKKINKFPKKTPLLYKSLLNVLETNCNSCSESSHNFVSESIQRKFVISNENLISFRLFQPKVPANTVKFGFLSCSIIDDNSNDPCGHIEKFFFHDVTNKESINLSSIFSHMEVHFQAIQQRSGRLSSENTGIRSLDLITDNQIQSSPAVDAADAQLCDDVVHTEVAKFAESKFIDCHLKRDVDFNVYKMVDCDSGNLTKRGCFLCYLCLRTKSVESKIKFFFTSSRSVVNSNIVAHLRRHFQSVAPTSSTGNSSALNTSLVVSTKSVTPSRKSADQARETAAEKRAAKRKLPPIDAHVIRTARLTRSSINDVDCRTVAIMKTETDLDEKENII